MRWLRRIPPIGVGLIFALLVWAPVASLLLLTRHQHIERAQAQLRVVSEATIKHSDRILERVQKSLEQLIAEGATTCSEAHRARMTQLTYENIEVRGFGVLDREKALFQCSDSKVYDPPLPVTNPGDLRVGAAGSIALVPPQEDVRKQQSIFVNYGLPDGRILDAAIYPEQFWSFQDFLGLGDGGGVYLANDDGRLLSGVGHRAFGSDLLHRKFADDYFRAADRAWVSVRRSAGFPITAVTFVGEETVLGTWRRNAQLFGALGGFFGLLAGFVAWRLATRPLSVLRELKLALRDQETAVHYQPILDLQTQRVIGAEALFRWPHKSLGVLPVTDVIAIATREGLLSQVTMSVLRQVQRDLPALLLKRPDFKVSINIGADDLKAHSQLDHFLQANSNLVRSLQLEVTERELIPIELEEVESLLRSWRALGIQIALDDFGTGYSNLSYLQQLSVDVLKIDRIFVARAEREPGSGILAALVQLAKTLNLGVIAEGIELPAQLEQMKARGVLQGQGWLFAKAEPIADLLRRLDSV
jgi:sensor c-di-GMP phosphodiesterase-like protein